MIKVILIYFFLGVFGCVDAQIITDKSEIYDLKEIISNYKVRYPNVDVYKYLNQRIKEYKERYIKLGIPERISVQMAINKVRIGYKDKNIFILDTKLKLLYLFDKEGKFISKTEIISGVDKQSKDPKIIKQSLLNWDEIITEIGFKWDENRGYVDTIGKGRTFSDNLVFRFIEDTKTRFLPKGIYTTIKQISTDSDYYGNKNNLLLLMLGDKELSQGIHGYYPNKSRTDAFNKIKKYTNGTKAPIVSRDYIKNIERINMSLSYGCINVPPIFLPYLRKYGEDAYVFNLGEDTFDYYN